MCQITHFKTLSECQSHIFSGCNSKQMFVLLPFHLGYYGRSKTTLPLIIYIGKKVRRLNVLRHDTTDAPSEYYFQPYQIAIQSRCSFYISICN